MSGIYRAAAQFIVHDLSNSFQRGNDSVSFSHATMVQSLVSTFRTDTINIVYKDQLLDLVAFLYANET